MDMGGDAERMADCKCERIEREIREKLQTNHGEEKKMVQKTIEEKLDDVDNSKGEI